MKLEIGCKYSVKDSERVYFKTINGKERCVHNALTLTVTDIRFRTLTFVTEDCNVYCMQIDRFRELMEYKYQKDVYFEEQYD